MSQIYKAYQKDTPLKASLSHQLQRLGHIITLMAICSAQFYRHNKPAKLQNQTELQRAAFPTARFPPLQKAYAGICFNAST